MPSAARLSYQVVSFFSASLLLWVSRKSTSPHANILMNADHPKTLHTYASLQIGDTFSTTRFISEEDVLAFAEVTGDDNPIHVDTEYAENTRFGHRIVHGVLLLGLISKVLGRDFPGHGSIAVSISCRFLRPVRVGSEVRIEVKIIEKLDKHKHIKGKTYVYNEDNKIAIAGEATLIPPTGEGE